MMESRVISAEQDDGTRVALALVVFKGLIMLTTCNFGFSGATNFIIFSLLPMTSQLCKHNSNLSHGLSEMSVQLNLDFLNSNSTNNAIKC